MWALPIFLPIPPSGMRGTSRDAAPIGLLRLVPLGLLPIYRAWRTLYDILQATTQKAAKPVKPVALIGARRIYSAAAAKRRRLSGAYIVTAVNTTIGVKVRNHAP